MKVYYIKLRIGGPAEDNQSGQLRGKEYDVELELHAENEEAVKRLIDRHDWAETLHLLYKEFLEYMDIHSMEGWKDEADTICPDTMSIETVHNEPYDYED